MMLWSTFSLLFFTSVGLAEKFCGKERVVFPAPVFGDGENLSAEGCGIWDKQKNHNPPWLVLITSRYGIGCWGILISPTSVLTFDGNCESLVKVFAKYENKDYWNAYLGKCAPSTDKVKCVENGEGQIVKVRNVTRLNAPGFPLQIWKIEKTKLKANFIAPICLFNKGNPQDFSRTQQYTTLYSRWDRDFQVSAVLSEDFGPCLRESRNFKSCDKVHENLLCAKLSDKTRWRHWLTLKENNRIYLRAFLAESIGERDRFYYEIFPLLDQIASLSGDISVLPKIPPTRKKTVFLDKQSFLGCGERVVSRRRRNPTDLMVQGENAKKNAQPWHAAMLDGEVGYFCGATLISESAVLTAAHCVFNKKDKKYWLPDEFEFVFGVINKTDFSQSSKNADRQKIHPLHVIPHPKYDSITKENDLAIVLLEENVTITAAVKPICLWCEDYPLDHILQRKGRVVGWGRTENQQVADILQMADFRIVPYRECYLTKNTFFSEYLKPTKNFCAGENGTTACVGDSGGGFYMNKGSTWYLRGIVSFGWAKEEKRNGKVEKICEGNIPSLYLDVTYYMDWIVQNAGLSHRIQN